MDYLRFCLTISPESNEVKDVQGAALEMYHELDQGEGSF
jgi:hypothetical protein